MTANPVARWFYMMVVILGWLAIATSASAECAWVLWAKQTQDFKSEWSISNAFNSREQCQVEMRGFLARAATNSKLVTVFGDNTMIVKGQDDNPLMSIAYTCLPDTVDPRGPKGK